MAAAPVTRLNPSAHRAPARGRRCLLGGAALAPLLAPRPARAASCPPGSSEDSRGICRVPPSAEPVVSSSGDTVLPSGVRFREVESGAGPEATPGATVWLQYEVLWYRQQWNILWTRGTGGEPWRDDVGDVYKAVLGAGDLPPGLEEGLAGARQGATRRVLVPPSLGWADPERARPRPPDFGAKRRLANHYKEPLLVQATVVRVVPPAASSS